MLKIAGGILLALLIIHFFPLLILGFMAFLSWVCNIFTGERSPQIPHSANGLFTKKIKSSSLEMVINLLKEEFEYESGLNTVLNAIREIVSEKEDYDKEVASSGKSIREIAFTLSANISRHLLACGQYHIYRGYLGLEGQSLYKIYNRSARILLEDNIISQEDLDIGKKNLDLDIADVG